MKPENNFYVTYKVLGWEDSAAAKDERKFRNDLLGDNHWSAESRSGPHRTITLSVTEEQAIFFRLKFPGCSVDNNSL